MNDGTRRYLGFGPKPRINPKRTRSRWRRALERPAVWAGGVITVVVSGVLTWQIQQILQPTASPPSTVQPSPSSTAQPTPIRTGSAIKVAALQVEYADNGGWVFPHKLDLTDAELRSLNMAVNATDSAGQELGPYGTDKWLRDRGAVDPGFSAVKLVLEGNREKPVRVIDMRPITRCTAPLTGTLVRLPNAGADDSVKIGFDLDKPRPFPQIVEGHEWKGDFFDDKTVSLKSGEQQTFQITTKTGKHYCEYVLELTIVEDGRTVTQTVNNNGKPFRVTAWALNKDASGPGVFSNYQALYAPDSALGLGYDHFIRQDPATYH